LRLQYAEAFQEADDWHKYATDWEVRPYNSATLEPEKLKSFEAGLTYKIFERFLISGTGYYTIVSNFIEEIKNTPEAPYHGFTSGVHYENITENDVTIYGYEFNMNAKIVDGLSFNANVSGAYNFKPAYKMNQGADGNYTLDPAMEKEPTLYGDIAPLKINAGFLYRYKNLFSVYPKVNYVSTKKTINWRADLNTPMYREIKSYAIIGLNINFINMLGYIDGLDMFVRFDNLTNTEYYNPGSRSADGSKYTSHVLQPGFNFMAGFSYNFK
jgi:outer membrane receptor protein involved in Fe transport